ncbi:MAG: Eco57I restriction-modification methylase domain-containing protein [Stellaceae bacterium]
MAFAERVRCSGTSIALQPTIPSLCELFRIAEALVSGQRSARGEKAVRCARDAILKGHDPLGDAYSRLRTREVRRANGVTLTPRKIVRSMTAWAKNQALELGTPRRVVDPGAGTGRFAIAAAKAFPRAAILAVERDAELVLLLRAQLAVLNLSARVDVISADFREISLPQVTGPTLFIGNPPYVRHHQIEPKWKRWYAAALAERGIAASQLAGLHLHFFAKVAELAKAGDYGCFITAAEWLDVHYGAALRKLLADGLGGRELYVLEPTAEAFPETMTTAAITAFAVGRRSSVLKVRRVNDAAGLNSLDGGRAVDWQKAANTSRWSILVRGGPAPSPGLIELGELCRVHRGQVTGANRIWIAGDHARDLPDRVLKASVTGAEELIAAAPVLDDATHLARVIDLPRDLSELDVDEQKAIEGFIRWAKSVGGADGYIARHRTPWWAIRLGTPAPIICTYMGRRPPVFVRNRVGAHVINIAHGLYPRVEMTEKQLMALVQVLSQSVNRDAGRTYAGGLTKFEPRELERALIPRSETLNA